MPAGQYFGTAGPVAGALLSFAVDPNGLRYFRLDMGSSCIGLGDVVSGIGIGLTVPSNTFSLCGAYVQFVPSITGASAPPGGHNGCTRDGSRL
jgi:hypothetical protein